MFKVGDKIKQNDLVGDVVQFKPNMHYHTGVVFEENPDDLIWHNNEMLSKYELVGKVELQKGDRIKSTYNDTIRTLKRRLFELDDEELGQCWEFEEDKINPTDWINHYEFVERRVPNEERHNCTNCGIPVESAADYVCSGGCAQEMHEREMFQ